MRPIMYHYVRSYDPSLPNFRFLHIDNFIEQLNYFGNNFGFVTRKEWEDFINNGEMPSVKGKVILTFDDATSCHYEYVFPELMKRNLWGIFYIPTLPYLDNVMLDVHKIHLLCAAAPSKELLLIARDIISDDMIKDSRRREFREQTYLRQKNSDGVTELKRLLNYYIDYKFRAAIIKELALSIKFRFPDSSYYTSKKDLKIMLSKGMIIGSHTNTHPVMSKLSEELQEAEIKRSINQLNEWFFDYECDTYCHPYGGKLSYNNYTLKALSSNNIRYAFSVDSRQIIKKDWRLSLLHLPRYDCNEYKFGQAS